MARGLSLLVLAIGQPFYFVIRSHNLIEFFRLAASSWSEFWLSCGRSLDIVASRSFLFQYTSQCGEYNHR